MSIRIRTDGTMVCGAMSKPEEGDTYIDDNSHYIMHVVCGAIRASDTHNIDGLWFWNVLPEMQDHWQEIKEFVRPI